jgi:hypothetical protein
VYPYLLYPILHKSDSLLLQVQTNSEQLFLALLASVCNLYKQCIVEQWFCDGYIYIGYKYKTTQFSYKRGVIAAARHSEKR